MFQNDDVLTENGDGLDAADKTVLRTSLKGPLPDSTDNLGAAPPDSSPSPQLPVSDATDMLQNNDIVLKEDSPETIPVRTDAHQLGSAGSEGPESGTDAAPALLAAPVSVGTEPPLQSTTVAEEPKPEYTRTVDYAPTTLVSTSWNYFYIYFVAVVIGIPLAIFFITHVIHAQHPDWDWGLGHSAPKRDPTTSN